MGCAMVLSFLLISCVLVIHANNKCIFQIDGRGTTYNLYPLAKTYEVLTTPAFWVNPCQVQSKTLEVPHCNGAVVCMKSGNTYYRMGLVSSQTITLPTNGDLGFPLILTYTGGDNLACGTPIIKIWLYCKREAIAPYLLMTYGGVTGCTYIFIVASAYACPGPAAGPLDAPWYCPTETNSVTGAQFHIPKNLIGFLTIGPTGTMYFNPCGGDVGPLLINPMCTNTGSGACRYYQDTGEAFDAGKTNTRTVGFLPNDSGISIKYTNGASSGCFRSPYRSTEFRFYCDPNYYETVAAVEVFALEDECKNVFNVNSSNYCKGTEQHIYVGCDFADEQQEPLHIACYDGGYITSFNFISFGNPSYNSNCNANGWAHGNCYASGAHDVILYSCLGRASCDISVFAGTYIADNEYDPCQGAVHHLAVSYNCVKYY